MLSEQQEIEPPFFGVQIDIYVGYTDVDLQNDMCAKSVQSQKPWFMTDAK